MLFIAQKQRFFAYAGANMMDSRWKYPLDDNSRTRWISGKFDDWFLEKNKKNIDYVKVLPQHMNIHIFDPENEFHSYMHILICTSSFFPEIPMNGVYVVNEMLCRRFFGVSRIVIWCLHDISTSRLSWPDCTVETPVSSCHRAVKWNMLIPQLKRHRKLVKHGIPKQPAITKLQYLLLLLHFRSSVQVHKYRSPRWILSGQKEWILTPFSLGVKKPTPARESRPGVMSQSSGLC